MLNTIVARHEVLRASFPIVDGELRQVIAPELELDLPVIDLTTRPQENREEAIQGIAREEGMRRYDLDRGPLIRAKLIKCADDDHVLLLSRHHLVFDGQSHGILYREIAALYGAFARNEPFPLAELPIQFGDYAAWQRDRLSGARLDAELSYWLDHLRGAPPLLDLPTDRPRPDTQSYKGGRCWFSLSNTLTEAIGKFSRQLGVTPFITLLAGFELLLHRYSGQDDFVLGTLVGGRTRPEVEELLGMFANTLPLRVRLDGIATVADHIARVRQVAVGAYAHQDMPFDRLVAALNPDRNASYAPVVQVLFGLIPKDLRHVELDDLTFERMDIDLGTARFDLNVMIGEDHGVLEGFFEYSDDLFDRATIERMIAHFENLLGSMVASAAKSLGDVDLLPEAERRRMLVEWNDTAAEFPRNRCIQQIFEEQVARTPEAVALLFENHSLTYAELNARANQLAHHLIALGVGPEVLVGLCLERSLELVIGLIAILKAGGAYVPLDPTYPKERLGFMLQDSQAAVLLTQQALVEQLPQFNGHLLCLNRNSETIDAQPTTNPPCSANSESLAYVIYTSGSTGRPKGVAITHHSPVALLSWAHTVFTPAEMGGVLASTSICFDLSVFELFVPLSCGGRVILAENALALVDLPAAAEVTLVNTVPSAMAELLRVNAIPPSVRAINLAGEALKSSLVTDLYERTSTKKVYDLYGPSETTTYSTFALRAPAGPQTIGKPISNTRIYVLDGNLQPVPIGVPGELHIGGDGLARGYLNRPELTAEKFLPDPFSPIPGARMYRTGDLVRYRADGNIEFLGRLDDQLKIRGFRVEPGEVMAVLHEHPDVRQAVVVARAHANAERALVAYIVPEDSEHAPDAQALRQFLVERVPQYMVPADFLTVEAIPLTVNGKLDRDRLPAVDRSETRAAKQRVMPRTLIEQLLADQWCLLLNIDSVGIDDNFFALGGDSLTAMRFVARFLQETGEKVNIRTVFDKPTIRALAGAVAEGMPGNEQAASKDVSLQFHAGSD